MRTWPISPGPLRWDAKEPGAGVSSAGRLAAGLLPAPGGRRRRHPQTPLHRRRSPGIAERELLQPAVEPRAAQGQRDPRMQTPAPRDRFARALAGPGVVALVAVGDQPVA